MVEVDLENAVRHEVCNHLTAIRLNAAALARNTSAELRRLADEIDELGRDAGDLMSQLRQLDTTPGQPSIIDVATLVGSLPRLLRSFRVDDDRLRLTDVCPSAPVRAVPEALTRQLGVVAYLACRRSNGVVEVTLRPTQPGHELRFVCAPSGGELPVEETTWRLLRDTSATLLERLGARLEQQPGALAVFLPAP